MSKIHNCCNEPCSMYTIRLTSVRVLCVIFFYLWKNTRCCLVRQHSLKIKSFSTLFSPPTLIKVTIIKKPFFFAIHPWLWIAHLILSHNQGFKKFSNKMNTNRTRTEMAFFPLLLFVHLYAQQLNRKNSARTYSGVLKL